MGCVHVMGLFQIASYFTDKLLRIVRDLQKHMLSRRIDVDDPELQLAREFPKLAGSHLVMGDVALEFIKHVCAVLALDNRVQHNVLVCPDLLALSFWKDSGLSIKDEFCATPIRWPCFLGLLA
jgi:hypothetical protein